MMKLIIFYFFLCFSFLGQDAQSMVKQKYKKKKTHSAYLVKGKKGKQVKHFRHSRKTKRRKHGTGPDLKTITIDSPYRDNPNNGINPVETL